MGRVTNKTLLVLPLTILTHTIMAATVGKRVQPVRFMPLIMTI